MPNQQCHARVADSNQAREGTEGTSSGPEEGTKHHEAPRAYDMCRLVPPKLDRVPAVRNRQKGTFWLWVARVNSSPLAPDVI